MKRIAVIGLKGLPAFGGAAAVGESIIHELKDHFDFTIYSTSSHTNLKTGFLNGSKQIVFSRIPFKRLNTLYYYILACFHALIKGKYDLIHLHHSDAAFIIPILKLKYKVIVTTHGAHIAGLRPKWIKYKFFFQKQIFILTYADIVTCVSLAEKEFLQKKITKEVLYIPNGVKISTDSTKKEKEGNYIFFGAGRIIKGKGLDILLKALKQLNYNEPLVIAGDLTQTNEYQHEILTLSHGLNIEFTGLIKDKKELLKLVSNAQLFIFPSSQEATSMMLLEAASVKTPIICSDIIENKYIFNNKQVLFFKTDNIEDLAGKIKYGIEHTKQMKINAQKAYSHLFVTYNWQQIAQSYKKIYQELLALDFNKQ